jgi:hypothetical protein
VAAVPHDGQGEHLPRAAVARAWRAVQLCALTVVLWLVVLPFEV